MSEKSCKKRSVFLSIVLCALLLITGVAGMSLLSSLKEKASKEDSDQRPIAVSVIKVQPEDITINLTSYGEVKALNEVNISSDISGELIYVNPKLEAGEVLSKNELLFHIDEADYLNSEKRLGAIVSRVKNSIEKIKMQHEIDLRRYAIAKRNQELCQIEYMRLHRLFYDNHTVSKSRLEEVEQKFNTAKSSTVQLSQAIRTFPYSLKQAECDLTEALTELESARGDLKSCKVYAPFDCRVKNSSIEPGEFVTAGQKIVTLADDSVLEIHAAIDSREVCQWLQFDNTKKTGKDTWFTGLEQVYCKVYWVEGNGERFWKGRLHRAVSYNSKTRTLVLAVRISMEQSVMESDALVPLFEGMFCRVEIPGKTVRNIFLLPSSAVSREKYVYLSIDNHLKITPIKVVRTQGNDTLVGSGLAPGDHVIISRLLNPFEGALLNIIPAENESEK